MTQVEAPSRTCTKCGESYPATTEFFNRTKKTALFPWCKTCSRAHGAAYRDTDEYREKRRVYRRNHRDDRAEEHRRWKRQNPDYYRDWALNRHYGITIDEYNKMRNEQDFRCAICGTHEDDVTGRGGSLHVDHDHDTGEIRGLLCWRCNLGVGNFQDDAEIMSRAISYMTEREG